jgi:hypothetical protein
MGQYGMLVSTLCTATALRGGIKHVYHPSCLSETCSEQLVRPAIIIARAAPLPAGNCQEGLLRHRCSARA